MKQKPILVGESNPYGSDPYYALYPAPDGCSGHRLCCLILGMQRAAYLEAFERRNLCTGKWSMRAAKKESRHLLANAASALILCGSKVCDAFGVPFEPFKTHDYGGVKIAVLPHPSGLCRLWNEPGAFDKARRTVLGVAPELDGLISVEKR